MGHLREFLDGQAVALDVEAASWEEAITKAGRLLEKVGIAEDAYTQSMIDSVHDKGPYIVVAPGFAFAHARPSEAVNRTGMSWVRLASPVEFGHSSNDPVTLVVALAAKDSDAHLAAMAELAKILGDPDRRSALDTAGSAEEVMDLLTLDKPAAPQQAPSSGQDADEGAAGTASAGTGSAQPSEAKRSRGRSSTKNHILTVCGNGVGTSLFLKNTLEKVLDTWGWASYITVEATDTVSAKGKAKEADLIMTSDEIGRALGDLGVPMKIIKDFTSTREIDAALRDSYDI